ncbi:methyltransferase domain-containing protein [Ornithinimicrobium tianjinense]|uniref:Ubiquinone/menaquinone biosynthesis methyltransferase n=1 Tax=Ornithinimicrobium tianjinense TaxID=1195761 RepID=A0A917F0V3_9MICO|nr:methyltransferase domain-containing protein [Ornithinimicrobium tianjinense]GGF37258.1 ubiquinone/menaquinone biosynthesis methyltransferase [Ornithinimicrobium tianjinense]
MLRRRLATPGPTAQHGQQLADEFDRAADRYDLLTRLNPGYHRALRTAARELVSLLPPGADGRPLVLWDLGCGSGLSTRALVDAAGEDARVVALDASEGMLRQARAKTWPAGVRFVRAFAQDLPEVASEHEVGESDGAFAAYLLRNVPEEQRDEVVAAIRDQVRPGGWVALQDYHVKGDRVATAVWTAVCWGVVTPLAVLVRGNPTIYRYLWRSVLDNDSTAQLEDRLRRAGLTDIRRRTGPGWQRGILHTVLARRPESDPT